MFIAFTDHFSYRVKQWNYVKQTVKLGYVIHFFWENYEAVKLCEAQVETVGLRRAWHQQNSMLPYSKDPMTFLSPDISIHRSQVQWPNGMA